MIHGSWDIKCTRQFFYHLGPLFALLPLTAWKMKISKKKRKTPGDIIIWHKSTKNHDHRLYCSWHVVRDRCNCYFSFWAIFCPFTPITAQKMKIFKNEKNTSWYHHFTHVFQKLWLDDVLLLRYGARETDGQTNGRTDGKSDT